MIFEGTKNEIFFGLGLTRAGTYLPPAEALLAMSELFGVSINELLSGKRLSEAEYRQAAEENLKQTVKTSSFTLKDRIDFYKNKWLREAHDLQERNEIQVKRKAEII